MTAQKVFLCCIVTLVLFNFFFFIVGLNESFLSVDAVIGLFVTCGLVAIAISVLPIIDSESTAKWFLSIVIMISILYKFTLTIPVIDWTLPSIGIGLVTNLTDMFPGDVNSLTFMPYLFFNAIGLIGLISGILSGGNN